jgi:hypothetical protein
MRYEGLVACSPAPKPFSPFSSSSRSLKFLGIFAAIAVTVVEDGTIRVIYSDKKLLERARLSYLIKAGGRGAL